MKNCAVPCPGCPNIQLEVSASERGGVPNVALYPDGSLAYARIDEDGTANFGFLSADEFTGRHPTVTRAIKDCEGPTTENIEVKRRGPLGQIGLTKVIIQKDCTAVSKSELQAIAIKHGRE